jgi:hypothetical protein
VPRFVRSRIHKEDEKKTRRVEINESVEAFPLQTEAQMSAGHCDGKNFLLLDTRLRL